VTIEILRFERFVCDIADRRLTRDGAPIELSPRYFDALVLLLRERGQLVTKGRFMSEVWRGVPVTDEALTQCIRSLRRALGDDAAAPKFIVTVPKHGYRFVAPVETGELDRPTREKAAWLPITIAAALGGGAAGIVGGILYGFVGISEPLQRGTGGAASLLTVLVSVCGLVGFLGGAGVGAGIASAWRWGGRSATASILGGMAGGLATGAVGSLVGHDAVAMLFGAAAGRITGPGEGAILGAAVGLAAWWATTRPDGATRGLFAAAIAGFVAGMAIALAGGRLMAGSLVELSQRFPASRLRIDRLGALLGEDGFGAWTRLLSAGGEGMLFAVGVVGALAWTRRAAAVAARSPIGNPAR